MTDFAIPLVLIGGLVLSLFIYVLFIIGPKIEAIHKHLGLDKEPTSVRTKE